MALIESALAGVLGNKIHEATAHTPHLDAHGECVHNDLHDIKHLLSIVARAFDEDLKRPDRFEVLNIPVTPNTVALHKHNYKHNSILVGNNTTQFVLTISGVGSINYTAGTGWTSLDLPEGAEIAVAVAGQTASVLYRCTDDSVYEGNSF